MRRFFLLHEKNLGDPYMVDDISSELATNRTYLSMLIKHSFRSGFRDFVNKTRLEKAQEIMSRTNSEGDATAKINKMYKEYGKKNRFEM